MKTQNTQQFVRPRKHEQGKICTLFWAAFSKLSTIYGLANRISKLVAFKCDHRFSSFQVRNNSHALEYIIQTKRRFFEFIVLCYEISDCCRITLIHTLLARDFDETLFKTNQNQCHRKCKEKEQKNWFNLVHTNRLQLQFFVIATLLVFQLPEPSCSEHVDHSSLLEPSQAETNVWI